MDKSQDVLEKILSRLDSMDSRFGNMEVNVTEGLDKMGARLYKMDTRFDKMDARFDSLESKVDEVKQELNFVREPVIKNSEGIADLNVKVDEVKEDIASFQENMVFLTISKWKSRKMYGNSREEHEKAYLITL
ncbi:archaellum component FlaC [Croceifilum oryzae]|uniref:Archaellum component FlaC n=1 Tax=Croceifilum oryzae TaxID=1553429 RepID=A0AAJ1TMX4_9BACL|nr:hypothetical protein [Croceifilum oryzae]MDQ0417645.1 archaellum component FlaC [Croceifilum oryzae]